MGNGIGFGFAEALAFILMLWSCLGFRVQGLQGLGLSRFKILGCSWFGSGWGLGLPAEDFGAGFGLVEAVALFRVF